MTLECTTFLAVIKLATTLWMNRLAVLEFRSLQVSSEEWKKVFAGRSDLGCNCYQPISAVIYLLTTIYLVTFSLVLEIDHFTLSGNKNNNNKKINCDNRLNKSIYLNHKHTQCPRLWQHSHTNSHVFSTARFTFPVCKIYKNKKYQIMRKNISFMACFCQVQHLHWNHSEVKCDIECDKSKKYS